jgi:hypothetical protein
LGVGLDWAGGVIGLDCPVLDDETVLVGGTDDRIGADGCTGFVGGLIDGIGADDSSVFRMKVRASEDWLACSRALAKARTLPKR